MRTGNKYLRYYLIQAADSVRKHDSVYRDDYQKKYQEVPKHQHKRSLVLTARKLVRLVYSLLITDQLYIPPFIYCYLVQSFFSAPFFKTYLFMKKTPLPYFFELYMAVLYKSEGRKETKIYYNQKWEQQTEYIRQKLLEQETEKTQD
ncbi:hypothetical protein EDD68_10813 [Melghiribacillus thermohalophilus]|uniref:Transposase IS116/IS110/IS902 family protein n=1 Tax=Melghiribacillus thermohalophilus TaxID=1324956 RepID=A0A4R3N1K0_9BACI|nr:hypothetical protein EDD68_10813 [Melghiribacillus thermohalophilus]